MAEIEITDRYQALGISYPDPETVCQGQCEGTGCVPVYVSRGDRRKGATHSRPDDETDKALRALWFAADEKDRSKDGWHFVECPDCGGTGKLAKAKPDAGPPVRPANSVVRLACSLLDLCISAHKIRAWKLRLRSL